MGKLVGDGKSSKAAGPWPAGRMWKKGSSDELEIVELCKQSTQSTFLSGLSLESICSTSPYGLIYSI